MAELIDQLHELDLVQQALAADHVRIALIELAVAALLRAIRTPHGLDLVAFEGEGDLVLMLHHVACKGHGEVVAQGLLGKLGGFYLRYHRSHIIEDCNGEFNRLRSILCLEFLIHLLHKISAVEHLEDQAVALLAVLAGEGAEVLHCGGLQRQEAVLAEHRFDGIENVLATEHLLWGEIAGTLGRGGLLCHAAKVVTGRFFYHRGTETRRNTSCTLKYTKGTTMQHGLRR